MDENGMCQLSSQHTVGAQQMQIPSFCILWDHLHLRTPNASAVTMETAPVSPLCPSPCLCPETECRGQGQGGLCVDEATGCLPVTTCSVTNPCPLGNGWENCWLAEVPRDDSWGRPTGWTARLHSARLENADWEELLSPQSSESHVLSHSPQ